MTDDDFHDEVGFWLHMIEWWETNNYEPAPKRMHEALKLAKSKFRLAETQYRTERRQPH